MAFHVPDASTVTLHMSHQGMVSATSRPGRASLVTQMEMEYPGALDPDVDVPARAAWGNKVEFILTCVGYAVGLGNVWRFPYLCYKNGGGAFLLPYLIMLALVGVPMFFMELSWGQFASRGPIAIWTMNPLFKGLGYTMVIAATIAAIYYVNIIGWCVYYLIASMSAALPWENCGNSWNTPACLKETNTTNITDVASTLSPSNITFKRPAEEYFYNHVLNISPGISDMGDIQWHVAACTTGCWVVVFLVLSKGISSLGKVVYFSSIFPYLMMTLMLVRGATLPGALEGIKFYLTPDFSKLTDAQVWSDAAVQIFYSLSTCTGGLVAMASYNKFDNNVLRDALLVPVINCATSLYAGFVIFSVLGFMAHQKGVDVADVAASGPGLVFVVYPEGLTQMPLSPLWAVMFFLMMVTLGFSSAFSMVEAFLAAFSDEMASFLARGKRRNILFRFGSIAIMCVLGLSMCTRGGFYLVNLLDNYIGGFPLLLVGLLECIAVAHVYGFERFSDDIEMMLHKRPHVFFKITWCFITPGILLAIIIFKGVQYAPLTLFGDYVYPDWSMVFAWSMVAAVMSFIPIVYFVRYMIDGGYKLTIDLLNPTPSWGPALMQDRTGKYAPKSAPKQFKHFEYPDLSTLKQAYPELERQRTDSTCTQRFNSDAPNKQGCDNKGHDSSCL